MKYLLLLACLCHFAPALQDPLRISDASGGIIAVAAVSKEDFVLESTDAGLTWRVLPIAGSGELRYFSASADGEILYAARSQFARPHLRSLDGGRTWQSFDSLESSFRIEMNPRDPTHLYALDRNAIQESFDSGQTWRRIEGNLPWTRVGLSLGPWIDFLLPGETSPPGTLVRTWAAFFTRTDLRQWQPLSGTEGLAKPSAFATLPGDRFLAQFGAELWLFNNYRAGPIRIPSPQHFTRFVADPLLPGRVHALAESVPFLSEDFGLNWTLASRAVPELTTWIAGKPVDKLTRHGTKYFAQGPASTDLRISRTDASGQLLFDWIYPMRGVQRLIPPAVAANGEIYVAGHSQDETPTDFVWRLNAAGEYLSGYRFEPRGDFQELRLEPNGDVLLIGPETSLRFDRQLQQLLP